MSDVAVKELLGSAITALLVLLAVLVSHSAWPFAGFGIGGLWAVWMAGCNELRNPERKAR